MKIVVCVKASAAVEPAVAEGRVDESTLKLILSEWDLQVLELLVQAREDGLASELVALTAGDERAEATLRQALAQGADRAIRVPTPATTFDPVEVAQILAGVIRSEQPDLAVTGVQSSDLINCTTGGALAAALDWPCATCVISLTGEGPTTVRVRRQLQSSIVEVRDVDLPAVLTVQAGHTLPRYPNFRAISRAARTPIETRAPVESAGTSLNLVGISRRQRDQAAEMLVGTTEDIARTIAGIVGVSVR